MNIADIVKALGGNRKLAKKLSMMRGENITEHRICKWKKRNSVPGEYWIDFVSIAEDADLMLSTAKLAQMARDNSLQKMQAQA